MISDILISVPEIPETRSISMSRTHDLYNARLWDLISSQERDLEDPTYREDIINLHFPVRGWGNRLFLAVDCQIEPRGVWQGDLYEVVSGYLSLDIIDEVLKVHCVDIKRCTCVRDEKIMLVLQGTKVRLDIGV